MVDVLGFSGQLTRPVHATFQIMTVRILLSIAVSCIQYGHTVNASGFFGLMMVIGAVLYRIRRKAQGSQLIKWQGMDDDDGRAQELVQEWHEHVDM